MSGSSPLKRPRAYRTRTVEPPAGDPPGRGISPQPRRQARRSTSTQRLGAHNITTDDLPERIPPPVADEGTPPQSASSSNSTGGSERPTLYNARTIDPPPDDTPGEGIPPPPFDRQFKSGIQSRPTGYQYTSPLGMKAEIRKTEEGKYQVSVFDLGFSAARLIVIYSLREGERNQRMRTGDIQRARARAEENQGRRQKVAL